MKLLAYTKRVEFWFISFITLIVFLPILAPILSTIGLHQPAKLIYFVYSFTCHQYSTRSLHLFDHQYAWCARDTGIWMAFWLTLILYRFGYIPRMKFKYFLLCVLPIALDGGIQTIATVMNLDSSGFLVLKPFYTSNNLFRFMTGAIFGMGISLLIIPQIVIPKRELELKMELLKSKEKFLKFSKLILALFLIYFSLVTIWSLTSSSVKPTNLLDTEPKIQTNLYVRRANGECPTNPKSDLFMLECFF
jgi:uncharacterized membrane protein